MSRRLNRPEDRLVARYLAFRGRWAGREATAGSDGVRDADLPFVCPGCGDRAVVQTRCDPCELEMAREGSGAPYR